MFSRDAALTIKLIFLKGDFRVNSMKKKIDPFLELEEILLYLLLTDRGDPVQWV